MLFLFQFLGLLRIEQFSSEVESACAIATLKYGLKNFPPVFSTNEKRNQVSRLIHVILSTLWGENVMLYTGGGGVKLT